MWHLLWTSHHSGHYWPDLAICVWTSLVQDTSWAHSKSGIEFNIIVVTTLDIASAIICEEM